MRYERLLVCALLLVVHLTLAIVFVTDRAPGTDAAATGFPLDDAWIHMVYGHSVAHSGLPYYNVGELEAGFTSPLWMIILAIAELISSVLTVSVITTVKIIGVLLAWATTIGIYQLCRKFEVPLLIAFPVAVLAAANPMTAFAQVSGMEIALAGTTIVWGAVAFATNRKLLCGILSGLAYWTRPECLLILPLFLAALWLSKRTETASERIRLTVFAVLPTAIAAAIWSGYCLAVTGHLLPNTFYAKYSSADSLSGLGTICSEILFTMPAIKVVVGAVLFVLGVILIAVRRQVLATLLLLVPWVFIAGVAFTRPMPAGSGSYFYWWRYVAPVLPLLFVPLALGTTLITNPAQILASFKPSQQTAFYLKVISLLLLLICFVEYPSQISTYKATYAWNCQNINEVQVEAGKWVKRSVAKDAAVFSIDAGAIKYFGERKTFDILGLNNHKLLFDQKLTQDINRQPDSLAAYMRAVGASYYVIFPQLRPSWVGNDDFRRLFSPVTSFESRNYTVATQLQSQMVVFGLNR